MTMLKLEPLPANVEELLLKHQAPPRLVAHLALVHDVAIKLCDSLTERMPELKFDRQAVIVGAATHDIGKAICKGELTGRGNLHEEVGRKLLLEAGFPADHARFAFTHGGPKREPNPSLEDLLVRTADAIWKGGRYHNSEMELVKAIAAQANKPEWDAYTLIDDILSELAMEADARLMYQAQHPAE